MILVIIRVHPKVRPLSRPRLLWRPPLPRAPMPSLLPILPIAVLPPPRPRLAPRPVLPRDRRSLSPLPRHRLPPVLRTFPPYPLHLPLPLSVLVALPLPLALRLATHRAAPSLPAVVAVVPALSPGLGGGARRGCCVAVIELRERGGREVGVGCGGGGGLAPVSALSAVGVGRVVGVARGGGIARAVAGRPAVAAFAAAGHFLGRGMWLIDWGRIGSLHSTRVGFGQRLGWGLAMNARRQLMR